MQGNEDAVDERHAPAPQRIGLDRIDRPTRPPALDENPGEAEERAAERGHQSKIGRAQFFRAAEAGITGKAETIMMDQLDSIGRQGDEHGRSDAGRDRQKDKRQFAPPRQTAPARDGIGRFGFFAGGGSRKVHRLPRQSGIRKSGCRFFNAIKFTQIA